MSLHEHGKESLPGQRHDGGMFWTGGGNGGMPLWHAASWLPLSPILNALLTASVLDEPHPIAFVFGPSVWLPGHGQVRIIPLSSHAGQIGAMPCSASPPAWRHAGQVSISRPAADAQRSKSSSQQLRPHLRDDAMFQVRVRRHELHSPTSSPCWSPDPDLEALLRSRTQTELTYTTAEIDANDAPPSDQDEAELRLFAAPADAAPQSLKIRISSPDADSGEPGLMLKKPRSYYFADEPTSEAEEDFRAAAIEGRSVLELSQQPWPGCALPWKVRKISPAGMSKAVLLGHPPMLVTVEDKAHKRTRKGKKSRIAIRKKLHEAREKESEAARLAREKEEAKREKNTRRNREKKLKQKAKQQAKKAADGAPGAAADGMHGVEATATESQPVGEEST
ncbi:hypothetical protein G6011_00592 [Alternaria panax]|uniref:Uncharacterized protein n=1 Tax=Alternaria panax TaxID=48097 RepID=A0AAD4NTS8_9PLEO|nr:hypothetical protein G6011_00592 [Alternaria panax]